MASANETPLTDELYQKDLMRAPYPVEADALAEKVYADARKYHEIWPGLINALAVVSGGGYFFEEKFGRWHVQHFGIYLHPKSSFHSFEDAMIAVLEDIKNDGTHPAGG